MLKEKLADLNYKLSHHETYQALNSAKSVKTFMEYHIYAVWDFMTLLKSLQQRLTCVDIPWVESKQDAEVVRFINEIVIGEESDLDPEGNAISHYSLYIKAMKEVGADTSQVERFIETQDLSLIPEGAREFVDYNLRIARDGTDEEVASAFLYGREKLIPEMFTAIKDVMSTEQVDCPTLIYYLERHIELDGDEHGPLAEKCLQALCGDDQQKWQKAASVAEESLKLRSSLWDAVLVAINQEQEKAA
ncbi:DUF3050 domain-containing protein [Kangiella sediminilitoris]|uniref:PF11251 family protein n=1 Tax=Kangiella sediminilitoris TaxID=1144748 RepID=A0A1B3B7Q4_9GAMM|nr:DUF3050 domain-containing protein [Kangiella sediminilitoris]AOE48821.1 PF11251 family protein [Kangiella sediminilitoris]